MNQRSDLHLAAEKLRVWCEKKEGKSFDPVDIYAKQPLLYLYSNYHHPLSRMAVRPLQLINFFAPKMTRRLLGISPSKEGANLLHMAYAYLRRYERHYDEAHSLSRAKFYISELIGIKKKRFNAWGATFAIPHEHGQVWPAELPLAHLTCRAIQLLIDFEDITGSTEFRSEWINLYPFFEEGLLWKSFSDGRRYCSYSPDFECWVYNIFADVAATLYRMDQKLESNRSRDRVEGLTKTLIIEATPEKRWPYAADGRSDSQRARTYDSYHTAFILSSLGIIGQNPTFINDAIERYLNDFFEPPTLKPLTDLNATGFINIANWPESVRAFKTLIHCRDILNRHLARRWHEIILKSYDWMGQNLRYSDGHFAHSLRWGFIRHDLESLRWGNSLMWEALETLQNIEIEK